MEILLNGTPRPLREGTTVAELLVQLEVPERGVAVERNRQIVPRALHPEVQLADGDRLEVVTLVGGG